MSASLAHAHQRHPYWAFLMEVWVARQVTDLGARLCGLPVQNRPPNVHIISPDEAALEGL